MDKEKKENLPRRNLGKLVLLLFFINGLWLNYKGIESIAEYILSPIPFALLLGMLAYAVKNILKESVQFALLSYLGTFIGQTFGEIYKYFY